MPVKLVLGIENLTNSTYFVPYQNSPLPGLAFVLGATVGWNKVF